MRWREALHPVGMQRVAVLAPTTVLRDLLVAVGDQGTLDPDEPAHGDTPAHPGPSAQRLQRLAQPPAEAAVSATPPDLDECERRGRLDLIAGEAQLEARHDQAVLHGQVAALVGWIPTEEVSRLATRIEPLGGAVAPLPAPRGVQPPTLLPPTGTSHAFDPLVTTYATVPYADVNPSVLAGVTYVTMFGIMFADAGHGSLLVLAALAVRFGWWHRLAPLRRVWLFLAGAGAASIVFGVLYGEFFGPTGVIPAVWLAPLENPVPLLLAAVAAGVVLLGASYALGSVNRFREGGWRNAALAPSGLAGASVFIGLVLLGTGLYAGLGWLTVSGVVVTGLGLLALFAGLLAAAGGGVAGGAEAGVELFDIVVRLGSNVVSFARLAAFGLTHAALGAVVWQATTALWDRGVGAAAAAVLVFLLGNALAFILEGVVAAIQALRLEYYELFSRIFDIEGRPFRPWHVPLSPPEVSP